MYIIIFYSGVYKSVLWNLIIVQRAAEIEISRIDLGKMSITLEGTASHSDGSCEWSGLWRFTKEKRSFLAFRYQVKLVHNLLVLVITVNAIEVNIYFFTAKGNYSSTRTRRLRFIC